MDELRVGNLVDVREKIIHGARPDTAPEQWEGINSTLASKKYPGQISLSFYVGLYTSDHLTNN